MNIEKSFPCSKLSFEQRALTRQADHNWTKFQRFFLEAYINYTYPYKKHEGYVGKPNELILENAHYIASFRIRS